MIFGLEKECLSKYLIEKVIGHGSFGTVFLASEKSTSMKVALKICPSWSDGVTSYLHNEILVLSLINSPYFPEFYHSEEHGSFFIMVLEYCPGETMLRYLEKNQHIEEETVLKIVKQLLDAVAYLHHHKIVHRDLKLENIIITDNLEIKICDFGFATFVRENQLLKDFCGSTQYCSPEMIKQIPYDGKSNDIWTLGICILKIYLGIKTFEDLANGTPITGYYNILDKLIQSRRIRNVLKAIFIQDRNKRAKIRDIYGILGFEELSFNDFPIRVFDPVIAENMKKMQFDIKDNFMAVMDRSLPEYYIYRLLHGKMYFKHRYKTRLRFCTKNSVTVIEGAIKYENRLFCCYKHLYFELVCYEKVPLESLLGPLTLNYAIIRLKPNRKVIQFPSKMLAVEYVTEKNKDFTYVIKLILICGETDDFVYMVSNLISDYSRSSLECQKCG